MLLRNFVAFNFSFEAQKAALVGLKELLLLTAYRAVKRAEHKGFYPDQYSVFQTGNKQRDKELGGPLLFSDV